MNITKKSYLIITVVLFGLTLLSFLAIAYIGVSLQDYPLNDDMNGQRGIYTKIGVVSTYIFGISIIALFALGVISIAKNEARNRLLLFAICSPIVLSLILFIGI